MIDDGGLAFYAPDSWEDTAKTLQQAAEGARRAGDQAAQSRHLADLALFLYLLGRPEESQARLEEAVEAGAEGATSISGKPVEMLRDRVPLDLAVEYALWLAALGPGYDETGQPEEATALLNEAVQVARWTQDRQCLTFTLAAAGHGGLARGQLTEALKCFQEAAAIHHDQGDAAEYAKQQSLIGHIYNELGQRAHSDFEARFYYDFARDAYVEALGLAREMGDGMAEGEVLAHLGTVFGNLGDLDAAIDCFGAAHEVFTALGANDRLPYLEESLGLAERLRAGA